MSGPSRLFPALVGVLGLAGLLERPGPAGLAALLQLAGLAVRQERRAVRLAQAGPPAARPERVGPVRVERLVLAGLRQLAQEEVRLLVLPSA